MKICLTVALMFASLAGFGCSSSNSRNGAAREIHVPRVEGVTIDGVGDEWGERGCFVEILSDTSAAIEPAGSGTARMRLGWDEKGLLLMLDVRDDVLTDVPSAQDVASGDSVEFYVYAQREGLAGYTTAVGWEKDQPRIKGAPTTRRLYPATQRVKVEIETARTRVSDGYVLEARLPWKNLGFEPAPGKTVAVQVIVNDVDFAEKLHQLRWFPRRWDYRERNLNVITLDDQRASSPQTVTAAGEVQNLRRLRVRVDATFEHTGQTFVVRAGSRVVGRGELKPDQEQKPRRASGLISFPLPPPGTKLDDVYVEVPGATPVKLELPDIEVLRESAFVEAPLRFDSFVFSGTRFPSVVMEALGPVEDAVGPFEVRTIFYDSDTNEVTTAQKAGRYGAVVEFHGDDGRTHRKYFTLFRTPTPVPRRDLMRPELTTMPSAFGIDPRVLAEQKEEVSWFFGDVARRNFTQDNRMAIFLAWLSERKVGDGTLSATDWPDMVDDHFLARLRAKHERVAQRYFVQLPTHYEKDPKKKWPALLYLHGSGERGLDMGIVRRSPLPARVNARKQAGLDFPFIVIAPQCPPGEDWSVAGLMQLLDEVQQKYRIDPDRVCVTGYSMGGYGAWNIAAEHPERFAALAPVCGGWDPKDAQKLKDLPTWVFHGDADPVVPIEESRKMVEALEKLGAPVHFTVYPGVGHDSWTATYEDDELWKWMLKQTRGRTTQPRTATATSAENIPRQ